MSRDVAVDTVFQCLPFQRAAADMSRDVAALGEAILIQRSIKAKRVSAP